MSERVVIGRDEFLSRFKVRLRDLLGERADRIGQLYWYDEMCREEGPETCAETEASGWGQE